jgi:NAD dependent epimerase/dehydratase family enzyme
MSWISLADTLSIIDHAIQNSRLKGPINVVTPTPVPNATFTRVLGGVLRRPTCLPAPAIALRCVLGTMANDLLLCSQRVVPKVLETAQFTYQHPTLEIALRALLKG